MPTQGSPQLCTPSVHISTPPLAYRRGLGDVEESVVEDRPCKTPAESGALLPSPELRAYGQDFTTTGHEHCCPWAFWAC